MIEFRQGKKIQHKFTKDYLWMLGSNDSGMVLCRTKDLRDIWFYGWELEEL